ncbi:Glycosyltransferase involved in cell wall bisynthesis (RfaB) (PDB:2IV7) [Commensalibacter communis]|uniref:glycosyltransferase n=1 Tax=Commensalibacter communis TaxID=2972786 RepID=UPI0022FF6DED|nr:glycosyltransferase [Commensalibacter communis]CAI3943877.1 Glycosyltransferase involved in cell wall bisynthesis (RfaB) (PDB:2IV7) [Commensalibacter communis]CAI3945170.1 Glycosyltransferase involved in cell wall bisynthesis (RfaB) (PDB:2IV7) [Commensalibacter communis]
MRIAYIINSMEGGGAGFPIPAILSLMRDYGAEVKIFALAQKDGKALPAIRKAFIPVSVREGGLKDHIQSFLWLRQQLRVYQPTHLWTSLTRATLLGQLAGLQLGIPVVSWQHAAYLKPWNLRLLKATRSLSQLWIGDSNKVTTLTQQRLKIPDEKIITWPIFKTSPDTPKAKTWEKGQVIRIASMGRLHPVKGYDVLIEACHLLTQYANVPPYKISIYGEGIEYEKLKTLIQHYHLENQIQLAGFTPHVAQTLRQYHLYIQPSRSEGFCIAAHEAMQTGLPVIASNVGELPFSIQDYQTGLTIQPNNPEALANALYEFLQQPELLYPMGQLARETVMNSFSEDRFNTIGQLIYERMKHFTPR